MYFFFFLKIDHEIEETGEDLGSEDTDDDVDDDGEDDYDDDDGFLVDDASVVSSLDDEEIEHELEQRPKRRISRIIPQSSSDDSDEEILNGVSNDIVSVSLVQVESSVVVETNTNSDAVEIVEGKRFPTTYLTPDNEEIVEKSNDIAGPSTELSTKVSEQIHEVAASNESANVHEVKTNVAEPTIQNVKIPKPSDESNDSAKDTEDVEVTAEPVSASNEIQKTAQSDASNTEIDETLPEDGDQSISLPQLKTSAKLNDKGREMAKRKSAQTPHRSSLPGIDPLPKKSLVKKGSRVSLGDLDTNRTVASVAPFEVQHKEPKASSKKNIPVKKTAEPNTVSGESASDNRNESLNTIESVREDGPGNVPFNVSTQEENNNQNSKKGI